MAPPNSYDLESVNILDSAPCAIDDFGFEYGDFKFNGYGGFRILETSMGKNLSYYFWMWDKDTSRFVKYPDLEMVGHMTFDYNNQVVNVSGTGGAAYHQLETYKYINDKLTLIEKAANADGHGYRKV